jgi:hypothetical protein
MKIESNRYTDLFQWQPYLFKPLFEFTIRKMKEMSKEEIQTFLMSGTLTGKITTVRKDGRPHVVPIWFILDGDDSNISVVFTTGQDSLKGKHMLRDMFERNTIATAMSLAMTDKSKEAIVLALMQSVEQISEPLQEYINSKRNNLAEFLNVSVDNKDTNLRFDILMDANHVLDDGGGSSSINNNFRQVLKEYGAVIIKILDGVIDRHHVESFADSLSIYSSITKNRVGLGLIIGEELTDEGREYASKISLHRKRGINHLILITKTPSYQPSSEDREQTSTI